MQAIILAGGEGLRLRPLTFTIPKPLMPVGDEPIMQRLIERLRASGVKEIGVATGYGFDLVEAYFKDGARLGVQLHYVREVAKLGTAGPLAAFADWARGPVIIVNGDILTLQDFGALHNFHVESGAEMTVGVRSWELRVPFGVIDTDRGRVVEVREKPSVRLLINAGLYVMNPSVLAGLPKGRHLDVPDLIQTLLASGSHLAAFPIEAPWMDVGSFEDLERASQFVERWREAEPPCRTASPLGEVAPNHA